MLASSEIRAQTFRTTKFREGYDKAEVDAFLARIALAVDTRTPVAKLDVVNARFTPTRFRQGYNQDQVDDFLDRIAQSIA